MPAVPWIVREVAVGEIAIGGIAEIAVVAEPVMGDFIAKAGEVADVTKLDTAAARVGVAGGRHLRVGQVID